MQAPWPEEMNRRLTSPPVRSAFRADPVRDNLLREGIAAASIHVTGNTVIDALLQIVERLQADAALRAR